MNKAMQKFSVCFLSIIFFACSSFASTSDNPVFLQLMGRLHPIIVHFPISIFLFVAVLELISFKNFRSSLRPAIAIGLLLSTISAILAVIFGLLLAQNEDITGTTLTNHRNVGIVTAILISISSLLHTYIQKRNKNSLILIYKASVLLASIGICVAGHFGGSLTHGENYLSEVFIPKSTSQAKQTDLAMVAANAKLSSEDELKLLGQVRAIFAHNCYKCHSSNKQEGKLRLDQKEFVMAGGKNGKIIDLANPAESELLRRVTLPNGHKEAMPGKGKPLSAEEIQLLEFWLKKGAPWPANSTTPNLFRIANLEPRKPKMPADSASFENPIDVWVNQYFKKNKIAWQASVDDKTYLKRAYLDIIGILPSFEETEAFAQDDNPQKRALMAKRLLARNEDYTQHWLSFWNDMLRNDYTGTGFITKGRFQITDWLYTSLQYNKPYNVFAKELLNPKEDSKGFVSGIEWRGTINASQRVEMQAAQNVSQVLLGLNLKCASCHDSFISDWKLRDAYAFANVFANEKLEINRCDKPTGKYADTKLLWQNLGKIDSMGSKARKMQQMADGLVQDKNGRLYRTLVNRIWKQMMGRGIVEPVDEMDNEPWSQDLLDWLAVDFVEKKYNIKELIFLIASSKIYQSPSQAYPTQNAIFSSNYKFGGMTKRRLSAEQYADAISQVLTPVFTQDEMKYKPKDKPSFTRASLVANERFQTALGRPNREVVITSRDSQANLLEALELTNGIKLNTVLKNGAGIWQKKYTDGVKLSTELYKKALRRTPTSGEQKVASQILGDKPSVDQIQDLFWAVILLPEFQLIN